MSFFDQIVAAESFNNLPYVEVGDYELRLDTSTQIDSSKGAGTFAIFEFTVVSADAGSLNKVGSRCACRFKLAKGTPGPGNAKSVLLAALSAKRGVKVEELLKADAPQCFGPDAPILGVVLKCNARLRDKSNKPGEQYTHLTWAPAN